MRNCLLLKLSTPGAVRFVKMKLNPQSIYFSFANAVDMFSKKVLSWIVLYSNEVKDILFLDLFFGNFNTDKDFMVINYILLSTCKILYLLMQIRQNTD